MWDMGVFIHQESMKRESCDFCFVPEALLSGWRADLLGCGASNIYSHFKFDRLYMCCWLYVVLVDLLVCLAGRVQSFIFECFICIVS